jgi:hypothetical protein
MYFAIQGEVAPGGAARPIVWISATPPGFSRAFTVSKYSR